jgi:hypothetical protein
MAVLTAGSILEVAKQKACSYVEDILPITVAVADPRKVRTGVSIQRDYPLTKIERKYGIPFGHLLNDPTRFISDPDELHGCKWGIEVHEAVFQNDALNEEFIRSGRREGRVVIALSAGIGNVLQNLRTVAYVDRKLFHVVGEQYNDPPPYCCLVEYAGVATNATSPIGVELLLFHDRGCLRVQKQKYHEHPAHAVKEAEKDFENQIRWAVCGYPLLIGGKEVSYEMTASNVSDFRHVWRLPKLQRSFVNKLASVSSLQEAQKRMIEFYFGFDEIHHPEHFVGATRGKAVTMPLTLSIREDVLETICSVCDVDENKLRMLPQFKEAQGYVELDPEEVAQDFKTTDYCAVNTKKEVDIPGRFFIDRERREITVMFLPAIYPHHIVGIGPHGCVANISIAGLSGRSGITIEAAKSLCSEVGLTDAVILDNGNDVIARIGGGAVVCHKKNQRQTRLTAALHFGYLLDPKAFGDSFDGFEMAFSTVTVKSLLNAQKQEKEAQHGHPGDAEGPRA